VEKAQKEKLVNELTEQLRNAQTLMVADYRGLSMSEIDALRTEVLKHGARFRVVKNTLTRRAAEAAGQEALLALLEGPTAIAFLESDGDPVAVAKALSDAARTTRILAIRGGLLDGRPVSEEDISNLAKLPPADILRGQVLGAILGPLNAIAGLVNAPLQNLYGLIEARIEQLGGETAPAEEAQASAETVEQTAAAEAPAAEPQASAEAIEETAADEAPAEESQASAETVEEAAVEEEAEAAVEEPQASADAETAESRSAEATLEAVPDVPEETTEPEASGSADETEEE
jgi:large subunit ribosomal protein L10